MDSKQLDSGLLKLQVRFNDRYLCWSPELFK